ncbi:hypothetical protein ACFL0Q_01365 [Thermodesulfobacteriota bacterium]
MRKKAEQQIRNAVTILQTTHPYRIDLVRERAGLLRKVFDKTILDMARVGTIELHQEDIAGMTPEEIAACVRQGNTLHVSFSFTDLHDEPETAEPGMVDVILTGMDGSHWERFEYLCRTREGKDAFQKIREMVEAYVMYWS